MLKVCSVFPSGKGYTREGDLKQTSLTTESRWGFEPVLMPIEGRSSRSPGSCSILHIQPRL